MAELTNRGPTTAEIAWVAGFLEGEGSFTFRGRNTCVNATQVQLWPLERLQDYVGGRLAVVTHHRKPQWSTINVWSMSGPSAIGVMMTIYTLMSPRRQGQIDKVLANWRSRPKYNALKETCPKGHTYDTLRRVPKRNGVIVNERGCSICKKAYHDARNANRRKQVA